MRVFNSDKTEELKEYDLQKGVLKEDTLIIHIDKVDAVEEEGHYETIAEYPNGGKDVEWIIDKERVEGVEEHDEKENIYIYIPYTAEELAEQAKQEEISSLKNYLFQTDYVAIKISELAFSQKDLTPLLEKYKLTLEKRENARKRINELEGGDVL